MIALYLLVTVAIMAGAAVLIVRATVAAMGTFGEETFRRLQSNAEQVAKERKVPQEWRAGLEKRLAGLGPGCGNPRKAAAHRTRAKKACLRRLRRLIRHFKRTSLVVDEETRDAFVSELIDVYEEWKAAEWEAMLW